ncbi:sodium/mannose cotransporter SLC5A10-like [Ylistrum balloti]|uniref:sodium/mannose cotransporter SLC5A10-like n=1 Tax=Ylistrum balloti TaxID=509963 RepID=UPI002905D984|nr:sodium/mannose cotransporter SLC5A10-like [Ylistrum balloti]
MRAGLDHWVDILVLVVYFVLVMVVGLWSMCRKEKNTVKGYFLAGRSMLWFPIGASLFSSNIGSEHFIGLAGSGAASGIGVVAFEWGAAICLPLLGWVFLPIYLSSGLFTIPEFLQKRFGGNRLRIYLSCLALFLYICTKISVDVYAGSVFVQQALGWNTYISITALLVITAVYTVAGGLAAVIFTDTLQTVIMLGGAVTLSILAFIKVGGISGLMYKYFHAVPEQTVILNITNNTTFGNDSLSTCGIPRKDAFHILRDPVTSDLPWPGVLIRSTFVSTWYWCADQVIVQRALAAKNIAHARGASIMAGFLKFLPLFLIIMPGMISRVLFPESVACNSAEKCMEVCENPVGCSNIAYPQLILGLAPIGMRGLMMSVMMAALMSSLTSVFNSAATVFTMDLWKKFRKQAGERELLVVGKVFVVILVAISIAWIPLIQAAQQGQLFMYIQAVTGYLAPPICSVFLLAVFVPRVNEQGAFWGMLIGQITGITRMILDFIYPSPKCGDVDDRPTVISKVHFTYFAAMVLVETAIVAVAVSLMTKRQPPEQIKGLTFWTIEPIRTFRKDEEHEQTTSFNKNTYDTPLNTRTSLELDISQEVYKNSKVNGDASMGYDKDNAKRLSQQKLHIDKKTNLFLNACAILLICVFVLLYAIFH